MAGVVPAAPIPGRAGVAGATPGISRLTTLSGVVGGGLRLDRLARACLHSPAAGVAGRSRRAGTPRTFSAVPARIRASSHGAHPRRCTQVARHLPAHARQVLVRRQPHLGQARDPRAHRQPVPYPGIAVLKLGDELRPLRPRAHQAHLARGRRSRAAAARPGASAAARGPARVTRGSPAVDQRGPVHRSQSWAIVRIL